MGCGGSKPVVVEEGWHPEPPSLLSCEGVEFGFQYYCFFGEWKKRKDKQWNEQWIDIYKVFSSKEAKAPEKIVMLHIQQLPVYEHKTNYKNEGTETTQSAFLYFKGSAGGEDPLPDGWVIADKEPSKKSTATATTDEVYWAYCGSEDEWYKPLLGSVTTLVPASLKKPANGKHPGEIKEEHTVTFSATVAGTVSDFDEPSYKSKMLAILPGLPEGDITKMVQGESVQITSIIKTKDRETATRAVKTIENYDTAALSSALGVKVESKRTTVASPWIVGTVASPWIVAVGNDKVESGAEEKNWRANKSLTFKGVMKEKPSTTTTVTYSSNDEELLKKLLKNLCEAKKNAGWKKTDIQPDVSKLQGESGKHVVPLGRMKVQVKPPAAKPKAASKADVQV